MSRVVITEAVPEDLVREVLDGFEYVQGPTGTITWGFLRVVAGLLERAPRLRIAANIAVGYDNVDVAELARRGVSAPHFAVGA